MITSLVLASMLLTGPPQARDSGCLRQIVSPETKIPAVMCALKQTAVDAKIDGFGADVTVVQTFTNPSTTPIEALYSFPLPDNAAVHRMRIQAGERIIEGEIQTRERARRTYDAAKAAGQMAALLDQERPNLFTQSIANLMPGQAIRVEIRYTQWVDFVDGQYEFHFPMTVGPRFVNGLTPDPEKVLSPATRAGSNISLAVHLDTGVPLGSVTSTLHTIEVKRGETGHAEISLKRKDEIPNRDFILRYRTQDGAVTPALLSNYDDETGGTFGLVVTPPTSVPVTQVAPREMIFVMDQSGSQQGFPIEKSKEFTLQCLKRLNKRDTLNVLGFSNSVQPLWPSARPATAANIAEASRFVNQLNADGGTELEKAVVAALGAPDPSDRLRMVVFNTDGMAGQEQVILKAVRTNRKSARMFAFGIGNSVNRYLINAMAVEGRGDSEVVTLADQASEAADRLYRRLRAPILTNVTATVEGALDITPEALPDVFLDRPIILMGRYRRPGATAVTLRGTLADGSPWIKRLNFTLTDRNEAPSLPSLWARRQIDDIERQAHQIEDRMEEKANTSEKTITSLALKYHVMSAYTSFVAVERRVVNVGGRSRTVRVPVEQADGVAMQESDLSVSAASPAMYKSARMSGGGGGRAGGGFGGGGFGNAPGTPASPGGSGGFGGSHTKATLADRMESARPIAATKIDKSLLGRKGLVEIQILLSSLNPAKLESLRKVGVLVDGTDNPNKVVFGRIDAAKLQKLAELDIVQRIEPLED